MSRPTEFEDLDPYDQQGRTVATFDPAYFLNLPRKTLVRLLKTIESLDKNVADSLLDKEGDDKDGQEITYRLRPTEKDRERKLKQAQFAWDRSRERYEEALVDPRSIPDWAHWDINRWAEQEGRSAIDWSATDEAAEG